MNSTLRNWFIALSFFGLLLAIYLFYSYITQPEYRPCTINSAVNCDAVISGEVSTTLGIPTALYGLIGYLIILAATFKNNLKGVLGMAAFGTIFCLRITFLEIFKLKVICPVCLLCQITMVAILILAIVEYYKNQKDQQIKLKQI